MRSVPPPLSRPDWVIIGMRHGDRCVLYASRTLTQVQLQLEVDMWRGLPTVTMTLEFHDYVVVTGASYVSCLQQLFRMGEPGHWGGQAADHVELDEAPPDRLEAARAYAERRSPRALGPG